ncbi:dna-directed rna polymerase 3b, chloroplastic [Nicotiana attenuata]|uniref:DNA-directed RNA polymerase n=1 Tax=Nicotiana attenuata TaxID=49451 RepID=A0A1J6KAD8_NICAT|nr:dna-directed rna polymerase 3b, chloroplastic [Nicotiana attenuata]
MNRASKIIEIRKKQRKKWDRSGDDHGIGCVSVVNKGHGRCGVSYRDKLENDDCVVELVDSPNHPQRWRPPDSIWKLMEKVTSSFLNITLEDEGGLMGKWILDFRPIHVRDKIVYLYSLDGISKDGSANSLEYYVSLERDIMVAAAVNLVVGEQPTDVYTGTSLCVHHVIRGDSTKDHAADSNTLLVKLLTNQVEKTLVKQTVATSVYKVTSTGRCEQFKRKGEEKGLINDDMLLFSASCYAAKFSLGAFYSFIQVDSLSTMVSRSCVLNSSVQSQFLYNGEHTFMLIVIPTEGLYSSYSTQNVFGVLITRVDLWISHIVSYEVCMVILLATYHSKITVIMDYLEAMVGENLHKEYEVLYVQLSKRPFISSYLNERLMTIKEQSDDIHSVKKIKMIFPVCLLYIGMRREGSLGRHFYVAKLPLICNFLCVVWGYKHENTCLTAVKAVKNLIHEYYVGDIKWNNFNV